tara:strand:- start:271 stop:507 length:237 start_codon:yes stop_codon:yes gene_type:complete
MTEDRTYEFIGNKRRFRKLVNYLKSAREVTQTIFTKKGNLYFIKEGVIALDLEKDVGSFRDLKKSMYNKLTKIIGEAY